MASESSDGDVSWLLRRAGLALPHDGPIDGVDAMDALLVPERQFVELLVDETGFEALDVDGLEPDEECAAMLPEEIARRHHAVPLHREDGGVVAVAFANPADLRARAAVELSIPARVRPVIALLTPLRRALNAAYGGAPIVPSGRRRAELPSETTQPLASATGTMPLVRLDATATVEQRLEALLLALVERGAVTHAEYLEALRRVLAR